MSPTPKKPAADMPGVQAAPPARADATPQAGRTVDFTDQASFQEGVDTSPYATAKSAERARKALGLDAPKKPRAAKGKVAKPKVAVAPKDTPQPRQDEPETPAPAPEAVVPGVIGPAAPRGGRVVGSIGAAVPQPGASHPHLHVVPDARDERPRARGVRPAAVKAPKPPAPAASRPEPDQEPPIGAPLTPGASAADASASFRVIETPGRSRTGRDEKPEDAAEEPRPAAGRRPRVITEQTDPQPKKRGAFTAASEILQDPVRRETTLSRLIVAACTVMCVLATSAILYGPSQELYLAVRLNERLRHELEMNQERVDALRSNVEAFQTAEGYQDAAHQTWGLVLPGEVYVNVVNATQPVEGNPIPSDVPRGSGQNTSTWATDILDTIFATTDATSATAVDEQVATITEPQG